jgi:hypothetical protein
MRPQRIEPRDAFMSRISVAWEEDSGPINHPGMLEDRSPSGAGISVSKPIPVGTKVKISGKRRELAGVVRYCRRAELSYLVGIKLDEVDAAWDTSGADL